ncbi:NUDIX hydrolase [Zavarzinia sp. CC-PAN008]|uniref:NUDIX hydrolase n=1 Tax=Zavarzinia sp. CC-PAN008 TaxID=3243332 RepID=UPI003F748827
MSSVVAEPPRHQSGTRGDQVVVDLSAVVVTADREQPRVLTFRKDGQPDALPSGPLEPEHQTITSGLRAWVAAQTRLKLGYVEQLYTFGDRDRRTDGTAGSARALSLGYLALVRKAVPVETSGTAWESWYHYLPWEDWREGPPAILTRIETQLEGWVAGASGPQRRARRERVGLAFGFGAAGQPWTDERVLDRYELLYEAGLVPEAARDGRPNALPKGEMPCDSADMISDHRRILATAIARLRGKIKYRPVVFELMPPEFTFLELQRTVEALSGVRLHKSNFRRLVETQGLVEETGGMTAETGGRPARLLRFRPEVMLERAAPGLRLSAARRTA